jgi:hypothetical protein
MLKHPSLCPCSPPPPLCPPPPPPRPPPPPALLLRLRTPTKSESTSSGISDLGAASPHTNLENGCRKRRRDRPCRSPCACRLHAQPRLPTAERQPGQLRRRWRWRHSHVRWPPLCIGFRHMGQGCGRGKRAPCGSASVPGPCPLRELRRSGSSGASPLAPAPAHRERVLFVIGK